jgi:hypothetical protein
MLRGSWQIITDLLRGDTEMYDTDGFVVRSAGGFVNVLPSQHRLAELEEEEAAKVCTRLIDGWKSD